MPLLSHEPQETFPCPKTACSWAANWAIGNSSEPARSMEPHWNFMLHLWIKSVCWDQRLADFQSQRQGSVMLGPFVSPPLHIDRAPLRSCVLHRFLRIRELRLHSRTGVAS